MAHTYKITSDLKGARPNVTFTTANQKSRRTWTMDEQGRWFKRVEKGDGEGGFTVDKESVSTSPGWFMNVLQEMGELELRDSISGLIDARKAEIKAERVAAKAAKKGAKPAKQPAAEEAPVESEPTEADLLQATIDEIDAAEGERELTRAEKAQRTRAKNKLEQLTLEASAKAGA